MNYAFELQKLSWEFRENLLSALLCQVMWGFHVKAL